MWLNLEMTCGTQPESKSSGPPWECRNSRKLLVAFAQGHEGMQRPTASLLEGMPGDAHQQAGSGHCFPAHVNGARNRSGPLGALPMLEKRFPPLEVTNNPGGANRWEAVWVSFSWPHACWIAGRFVNCPDWFAWQTDTSGAGAWLAVLRVFRFPTPLSGDRCICPIMRRRPGSFTFHTPEQGPATSGADVPHNLNSGSHTWCSGRLCARGCGCFLLLTESTCECGAALDRCGRHRAACPWSGRLKSRATGIERTLARVFREAGDHSREHT